MAAPQDTKTKMTIRIGGRSYPVLADKEELDIIPIVEKRLNDAIHSIQTSYSRGDMQDYLSMLLLKEAVENAKSSAATDIERAIDKVNDINTLFDKFNA